MDRRLYLGVFAHEEDVVAATHATRMMGYEVHDVYTPYAVHGLPEAMGLKRSRLPWVCLAFALSGFATAILGQFWIATVDWPLNVGGKPFNSLPAFLPVMFECIVLFGGVGVTLSMLARAGLFPGKRERLVHPGVTNDRFVLTVVQRDASFDLEALTALWTQYHAVSVEGYTEEAS
jgi:hypothetical protein